MFVDGFEFRSEEVGDGRVRVVFSLPTDPDSSMALLIDTERELVLEHLIQDPHKLHSEVEGTLGAFEAIPELED